jgi:hypothetical protein
MFSEVHDFGDDRPGPGRTGYLECDTFEALMQACGTRRIRQG